MHTDVDGDGDGNGNENRGENGDGRERGQHRKIMLAFVVYDTCTCSYEE